jgi:hypothetical protein
MIKETFDALVHHRIKPLFLNAITYIGGFSVWDKVVKEKREKGFKSPLVNKIYNCCERVRKKLREEEVKAYGDKEGVDWRLDMALAKAIMISCIIADSERYFTPIAFNMLLEEFKKEGLLEKQPEPKKIKSKNRYDKHGNLIERTIVDDNTDDDGDDWIVGNSAAS